MKCKCAVCGKKIECWKIFPTNGVVKVIMENGKSHRPKTICNSCMTEYIGRCQTCGTLFYSKNKYKKCARCRTINKRCEECGIVIPRGRFCKKCQSSRIKCSLCGKYGFKYNMYLDINENNFYHFKCVYRKNPNKGICPICGRLVDKEDLSIKGTSWDGYKIEGCSVCLNKVRTNISSDAIIANPTLDENDNNFIQTILTEYNITCE